MRNDCRVVVVFEWLCGGGMLIEGWRPDDVESLLMQGQQMLAAVCADLKQAGATPVVPVDHRLALGFSGQQTSLFQPATVRSRLIQQAQAADHILIIAPETNGRLTQCLDWLGNCSGKLLNPSVEFTRLCSDKNQLMATLAENGIPVPRGCPGDRWESFRHQSGASGFVVKPGRGCGGEGVKLVSRLDAQTRCFNRQMRIEEFVPGTPVSVAMIRGRHRLELLPALRQVFDGKPVGRFVRCVNDLDQATADRALGLARKVAATLPDTNGFFGIDMVIGEQDVVIEINPRITMSYPVLRKMVDFNIAEQILHHSS